MQKNKQKLLYISDILRETDETHPITTNRIVSRLKNYGVEAERKSVLRDIAALIDYGYDIVLHSDNKLGYYLASRDFEDWELKILCDAVSSASFLTKAETDDLTRRICGLSSSAGSKTLKMQNCIKWQHKSADNSVKYNIDKIMSAISNKKTIRFQYLFTDMSLNKRLKRNGFIYSVSPYVLYWRMDKYYLIGCTENHDNLSCYRIDRINKLEIGNSPMRPAKDILGNNFELKISEYVQNTLYNFSGPKITLELIAENCALDDILDCFGNSVRVKKYDNKIHVTIRTTESEGLYRWLMEYSSMIVATAPESVISEMKCRLNSAAAAYSSTSSFF